MSQAGYTPISLYYSTTAAATPSAGNLVAGELALNTVDEKLYFKNSAGTVKLLASNATSAPVTTFSAGSTGLTPSSATAGAVTLAGTLAVANGGTGLTAGTSGGVLAYTAAGTLASSSALAASALVIGGGAGAAPSTTTTGTGVVTALGVNTGTAGAFVVNGGALGTPSSGTVTNLTGTASININGTVGATTPAAGSFTTVSASTQINVNGVNNTDGNVLLRSTTTRANTNNYGIRFADSSYETNASIRAIQNNSGNNAAQLVFGVNAGVGGINLTSVTDVATLSSTGLAVTGALSATGATTLNNDLYVEPNTAGKKTFIFTTNAANVGRMDVKSDTTIMVSLSATNGTVTLGNRAVPSDGTGIAFPATQNASADANTLDDYEEGTYTATITCGTSGTITLGTATVYYTKIGRQVTVTGYLGISTVSSPVGILYLNVLPFPVANNNGARSAATIWLSAANVTATTAMQGYCQNNQQYIIVEHFTAGSGAASAADFKNSTDLMLSATYFV